MELKELLKASLHEVLDPLLEAQARKSRGADLDDGDGGEEFEPSITRYLRGAAYGVWQNAAKEKELYEETVQKYSSDVGTEGGILIHPKVQAQLVPLIRRKAVIRSLSPQVVNLPNTNGLELPRQTEGADAVWVGESEDISAVALGEVRLGDLELSLKTVAGFARVPNPLLEDSSPAADRIVREDMSKVIAQHEDEAFLIGNGGKAPLGLFYWSGVSDININAQLAGAAGYDLLIDAQTAMDNQGGEYSTWLMNPTMRGILRKLKDNDDRHIWTQGDVSKKEPDTLFGIPCRYTRQIPTNMGYDGATVANRTFIVLGYWPEYLIAQKRAGISMDASKEAAGAFERNQTVFRGIRRVDGGPRVLEDFYILKNIHTA